MCIITDERISKITVIKGVYEDPRLRSGLVVSRYTIKKLVTISDVKDSVGVAECHSITYVLDTRIQ